MKKIKKYLAGVSALAMMMACQNLLPAHGEHVRNIVVLGDSISTGAGLAEGEKSYVEQLEDYTNIQVKNFAQDNYTTDDVLNCLTDAQVQTALNQADVILIAVGEHDIMDEFMKTTNSFMSEFGFAQFIDVFTAKLEDYGFNDENELLPYSNQMAAAIRTNQQSAGENIQLINAELAKYTEAKIIYQTAYNLLDNIEHYSTLSAKRKAAYNSIMNPTKSVLNNYLNTYITQFAAEQENCILIDVYTGFQGNAWQYTNLYQLDMNPNAAGHAWIADKIIAESQLSRMGDVNSDQKVDAADAAAVLKHAASIGSGLGGTFDADQIIGADVDENGIADSLDAAQILSYATASGSGKSYTFRKSGAVELVDPDPDQPDDEFADPDPNQPDELTDPAPDQPDELADPATAAPVSSMW